MYIHCFKESTLLEPEEYEEKCPKCKSLDECIYWTLQSLIAEAEKLEYLQEIRGIKPTPFGTIRARR